MDPLSKEIRPVPQALRDQPASAPVMTYARLRQTHEHYDSKRMEELHDLHAGGYTIRKKASKYLPQLCNEHRKRYEERKNCAAYRPYFGQIVENFSSDLFSQPLTIIAAPDKDNPNTPGDPPDEFYKDFEKNCDLQGTTFVDLMAAIVDTALVQRCGYVAIDAPDDKGPQPANLAEEEARGTRRLYAYEVSPRQVIDWKDDTKGGFVWVIIATRTQDRATPEDTRDKVREEFKVWTMRGDTAVWRLYAIEYKTDEPPKDEDVVPLEDEGSTSFKRIPLLRLKLPKGLWVGNKIGPQALEHWQRRSTLNSAENRSMVAIPYIKRGSEIGRKGGPVPSETQQDEHRGHDPVSTFKDGSGFVEIGADDELGFAEPGGSCYELVDKQLDADKDEMFRVNHQMAASVKNTPSSLGRSGLSKQKDGEATAKVLRALGEFVRKFGVLIFETIQDARGEKTIWTANGLDNYEITDREAVLEESISIDQVSIPSPTFKKAHKKQVGRKLITGLDPQTWAVIDDEIDEGVDSEVELKDIAMDAQKEDIVNRPPPGAPGGAGGPKVKSPGVKSPTVKPPVAKPPTVKTPAAGARP